MKLELSNNLRALRVQSKRTLEDVAEIIDVSRQSVSKWESGESYPDIEKCVRLAKLYNVSIDALINKPVEQLMQENAEEKYVFGLTKITEDKMLRLPDKALSVFEITTDDTLLLVGDKRQGIAVVKCGGINSFIDEDK